MVVRLSLVAAVVAGVPIVALAQAGSTAQVYGQVTSAVTVRDNQVGGSSLTGLSNSLFAASLIGFRGTEDLGGGMSAVYRLEAGINSESGVAGAQVATSNKLFNRQSFVGLNLNPAVTITAGRQFHAATDRVIQSLDVYNVGGTSLATTPLAVFGVNRFFGNDTRADSSVKIRVRAPQGFTGALSGGFSDGTVGARRLGSYSMDLAQVTQGYTVGAYYVTFQAPALAANGTRPEHTVWGVGGNAKVGPAKVYAHYIASEIQPSAVGRLLQDNKILHLGLEGSLAPKTVARLAWYHDKGTAINGLAGRNGKKDTWIGSVDYLFSRRTSVHVAVIDNRFSGGYMLDPTNIAALGRDPTASSTRWLTAGIRHDF